ncbi:M23 family metallopeptidase [Acidimicrobiales bacterium]|nr:M23 family metallopeptidase [Acidimicrobiales bacterium]
MPSPTPVPTAMPFAEAAPLGDLAEVLSSPLPDCGLLRNDAVVAGTVTLTCIEEWSTVPVVAAATGRIVGVVRSPAVDLGSEPSVPGQWSWAEQASLGPHVIVDHGPFGGTANTQTVYAGLAAIEEGISVGTPISGGEPLGTINGPGASLQFSVWSGDQRQDGARALAAGPPADQQRAVAQALRDVIASPTDERCPLVLSSGSLPGAPRSYRNGTHRGIDFGCGDAGRSAHAITDGTVVYLVNDYDDPSVAEREALLQQAGLAGFTPHWTLVMLYGNVVVVDHGEIPGAGRVVTISAHLEEIDPLISLGDRVSQGQRLGELGNRGTNASAQGIRGAADPTLHLHWELFIDNWYLGSGLDTGTTIEVTALALCGAAQTAGCPT